MTDASAHRPSDVLHRRVVGPVRSTARVVRGRRDSAVILVAGVLSYYLLYAYTAGSLASSRRDGFFLQVAADPASQLFRRTGVYTFEPIARIGGFGVSYLFSPIDASIALLLAILVGANLAVSYLVLVQPRSCGLTPGSGLLAAIPALLSGAACCGPIIFVLVGIQATGILLTGVTLLLPLSIILLATTLLVVGRQIDTSQL